MYFTLGIALSLIESLSFSLDRLAVLLLHFSFKAIRHTVAYLPTLKTIGGKAWRRDAKREERWRGR